MTARRDDADEIRRLLEQDVEATAARLLPGGKRQGREWVCSGRASPTGAKLCVVLSGRKAGLVSFFGGDTTASGKAGGSFLDLYYMLEGRDWRRAFAAARADLGISDNCSRGLTPEEQARRERDRQKAEERKRRAEEQDERDRARRANTAGAIWRESVPFAGTPAAAYLEHRGIGPEFFADAGDVLRFHPALAHPCGLRLPALVALVVDRGNAPIGVWRIFVAADGRGKASPAGVRGFEAKLGLGPVRGGAVRIGGVPANGVLRTAEGLETSLAVREIGGTRAPVWPLLSTAGMVTFEPPAGISEIRHYGDRDKARVLEGERITKGAGEAAFATMADRLQPGIRCSLAIMRQGVKVDWLDVLRRQKGLPDEGAE